MAYESSWFQPLQAEEVILTHEPVSTLWSRWNSAWVRHVGVIAVLDDRKSLAGVLRPYDLFRHLLQLESEVYHLWPYTHVIARSWTERINLLNHVPAGKLIRDQGVVIHNPPPEWTPSVDLFARHMTPVIWIADQTNALCGKATLKSVFPH